MRKSRRFIGFRISLNWVRIAIARALLLYQSLQSLTDFLVVAQNSMPVEHHSRKPSGVWALKEYSSAEDVIELTPVGRMPTLGRPYERVEF